MYELDLDDVEKRFNIKCNKYKEEDLTDELKNILFNESVREAALMNCVNNRSLEVMKNRH